MLGAIVGDIVGSVYEFHPWPGNPEDFPLFSDKSRFTDDTVLSFAIADGLMDNWQTEEELAGLFVNNLCVAAREYPHAGYGARFRSWASHDKSNLPYNSFGNGSAMRVSPVAHAFENLEDVEKYAAISASVTHNHPEGIKGACAVAGSIFLAKTGKSKSEIRDYVINRYAYKLDRRLLEIKPDYCFDETCQGSVPEALLAFLESDDFESAIRKAVWLGGDADTQAAIAGSIAEPYYGGIPEWIRQEAIQRLDANLHEKWLKWEKWLKMK